ncbi:hypothetical protein B0T09DRAFT_328030 [Sordaria sp. MPI-SDFR-AT-0083]|nr:hypothetical protein B0T09DRAFT_328030 [Sordaria sp. MPI-SDFR-AT-0083]
MEASLAAIAPFWLLHLCLVPMSATSPRQNMKHHRAPPSWCVPGEFSTFQRSWQDRCGAHPQWSVGVWGPFSSPVLFHFLSHHPFSFVTLRKSRAFGDGWNTTTKPTTSSSHRIVSYHYLHRPRVPP